MGSFSRDELNDAFRSYWQTGAVGEDWSNWVEHLTPDVDYREQVYGHMTGREEVRNWIVPLMQRFSELYTIYQWHQVDQRAGRVVVYMLNRRDHPAPDAADDDTLDFPGITLLSYAGSGLWHTQEDYWAVGRARDCAEVYAAASALHDPEHASKQTRRNWGDGPEWTRGTANGPGIGGVR